MEKTLITYSTVDGQTKRISERLAKLATQSRVDVLPISNQINLDSYKTIIIGASIRYGKYRNEVFNFIENNIHTLNVKENAFFSVNVVARKPEKSAPETNPYLIKFLDKIKWKPKNLGVFAGKIEYPKYKFIDKYAIKFIMWLTKGPTDTSKTYEFTDWNKVGDFARDLKL
jgi:menaquinone-dependent protoporphyrinogen oxidase|tara:strand:- start:906 stop:1418 length:513 start_codon:yes stop_codon:yes gene_type:complete